jgi:hypothetical protein
MGCCSIIRSEVEQSRVNSVLVQKEEKKDEKEQTKKVKVKTEDTKKK